ncbi:MAG: DUF4012 domain-containing protein [Candidatus Liptonbacteria bacterium]|nr:DUF4012 domain-containing protein [Candidatus Liptonbacteria bacterium]
MEVPKKNISDTLCDLKPPQDFVAKKPSTFIKKAGLTRTFISEKKNTALRVADVDSEAARAIKIKKDKTADFLNIGAATKSRITIPIRRKMKPALAFFIAATFLIVLYGSGLYGSKETVVSSFYKIQTNVLSSAGSFKNLKTNDAYRSLQEADNELKNIKKEFSRYGLASAGEWFGFVFPTIKNVNTALRDMESFFGSALNLSLQLEELKTHGLQYFMGGDGIKFTDLLSAINSEFKTAVKTGEGIANISSEIKNSALAQRFDIPDITSDLTMFAEAYAASDFIESLLAILKSESESHLLLLFQNSSEIRPGGGFLGSYADLAIRNGALAEMDVRDIYDPDGWLNLKLIPPKALQAQTIDWEARDSNWFLDFSLSAEKVVKLLEASKFYEERGVKFAGVIAVNTGVLESLIKIAGPIELPEYDLVLDENNFLEEIQNEVETGRNKAQNKPKKILADMTPKLLGQLQNLNDESKVALFETLTAHSENKDIQIYFKDDKMQAFMDKYNLGGDVYDLPQGFFGDYLAVINANVAGGKTDAYINQDIILSSKIDSAGTVKNELKITRTHSGGKTKYSWYNVTNKVFTRVLTPDGARLADDVMGATERTVKPSINYEKENYSMDPDLELLEKQKKESGKNVFEAWIYTNPGALKTLILNYENNLPSKPKAGLVYKFVLDKQSGVNGGLKYALEAPPGFVWKEPNSATFEYDLENIPWRAEINLTLEEI